MRCEMHCPKPGGFPVLAAVAVVGAAALLGLAWTVVASAAEAVALTVLALCVAGSALTVRFIARSRAGFGIVVPQRAPVQAELVRAPYQIEAPPLAIEAPDRYGVSPGDASAVTVPAVVPGVRDGAKLEA